MTDVKVYVAAASSELERVEWAHSQLRQLGCRVLSDVWVKSVWAARRDGKLDRDLSRVEQARHARADLSALANADIVWLLVPSAGHTSRGAWVELGAALALRIFAQARDTPLVVCSGDDNSVIFAALANCRVYSDKDALMWIKRTSPWIRG